ncbi:ras-related protein Rap-1b isoform X1 [Histomonas meleagridis]|uniref:ras-related protein Rap-1b isoform X1 n=1 Tax=Histomonas meleagridis TaxID=135588 RepID=UPI00355A975A|nr:ras-related protein Rap-1b isoform X1 [Histomonas meleagridis]KAH0802237.1 ras-related protein Rap-1b isoform X1 [Histomonas meleagridis]
MTTESFQISVLGSGGVGKTCLILRLTRATFDPEYIPTIQDYFDKDMTLDGKDYTLKIIDTAGQDEMQGITDIGIKDSQAAIIIYSITSQISFNEAEKYRDKVMQFSQNGKAKVVLVGNKCDIEPERVVPFAKGQELAKQWGCPFFETSAKKDINVTSAFEAALKLLISDNKETTEGEKGEGGCCNIS